MPAEAEPEKDKEMTLPEFSMRQLLEAGVHFGHNTRRWDPRMEPYIYGVRNAIHIIDLQQTVPLLHQAMTAARDIASKGGRVLFVGTKRTATDIINVNNFSRNLNKLSNGFTKWKFF